MASPTKWNIDDKFTFLSVSSDGLEVTYVGPGEKADSAAIRADLPILPQCGLFYFEINILDKGDNGEIGIGFCAKTVNLNRMPGWENNSWGYHGDDGNFYCCSGTGKSYGPLFTTGDTIGCCLNFRYKVAFYTKNGVHLGIAFQDLEGELYPCVGMRSRGGSMKVNFGHEKFKYTAINDDDISDKLLKEKWIKAINQCNDELEFSIKDDNFCTC
ncbi:SPRY-domain-containing protein [Gigaspora margarita]|uniref:SPRY-domain-containing protein n=1 Tax=Gigaspora margarita TaxID=4874 RepID=A0A8H4AX99_GIGMA|nr:SPRY-domain-containing protein [Gigaspora margarita]